MIVERTYKPVPPSLFIAVYDGRNAADCIAWLNGFPEGATNIGGQRWQITETAPNGDLTIFSQDHINEGDGIGFVWPVGWCCTTQDHQSFGLPGDVPNTTRGWVEVTDA